MRAPLNLISRTGLATFVAASAALAGCTTAPPEAGTTPTPSAAGLADLSAEEILARAAEALEGAPSYRVSGQMTIEESTSEIEMVVTASGDLAGTITVEGETIEIIQVGTDMYLKPPESLLALFAAGAGDDVATLLADKYLKTTTDDEIAGMASVEDPIALVTEPTGPVTKGETRVIDGVPTIGVVLEDGMTVYLATEGEPYPVLMEGPGEDSVVISDIGTAPQPTAPPADEVIDLASLGLGGLGGQG